MSRYWLFFAVVCMAVTAGLALNGTGVSRTLFLVELLITLSLVYVHMSGGLRLARLFDLPVLVTARIAFSFGILPIQAILMPEKLNSRLQGDYDLILQALLLVIVGMVAFWAGCKAMHSRPGIKAKLVTGARSLQSTLLVALGIYGIGFVCKLYLLQHQLFAYTRSSETYKNNLAGAQWFMFGATFATFGLLLICIEQFSHRSNGLVRWLFWGIVLSECGWGLLSGMKEFLLIDFLAIGAVATLCHGKLAKKWVLSAVFGLVLLYPLYNAYRSVIRGGSTQVSSFAGAFGALSQATTNFGESGASGEWIQSGTDLAVSRLDLLQTFALILSLPNNGAELQGDERLWMIPFISFIPRTIWPDKPVLDKGNRFNKALGGEGGSSEAVPYVADCYMLGGVLGVIAGMFALGLFTQRYANCVKGAFSKKDLFRYSVVLLFCFKIEVGIVEWWALVIKTMVAVGVVEWLAYGPSAKRTARTGRETSGSPNLRAVERTFRVPAGARRTQYGTGS